MGRIPLVSCAHVPPSVSLNSSFSHDEAWLYQTKFPVSYCRKSLNECDWDGPME